MWSFPVSLKQLWFFASLSFLCCLSLCRPCKRHDARQTSCRWLTVPWWVRRICSQDSEYFLLPNHRRIYQSEHTPGHLSNQLSKYPPDHPPYHPLFILEMTASDLQRMIIISLYYGTMISKAAGIWWKSALRSNWRFCCLPWAKRWVTSCTGLHFRAILELLRLS